MAGFIKRLLGRDTPQPRATRPAPSVRPTPAAAAPAPAAPEPAAAEPAPAVAGENALSAGLLAYFTQDHRDCDGIWAEVEAAAQESDNDATAAVYERFEAAMKRHLDMEEQVIFPAFEQASGMTGGGPTFMMRHEHDQMRAILGQMRDAVDDGDSEMLLDQGDTLMMLIQQHNVKEEGMLYPMSEQYLRAQWGELSAKLERV